MASQRGTTPSFTRPGNQTRIYAGVHCNNGLFSYEQFHDVGPISAGHIKGPIRPVRHLANGPDPISAAGFSQGQDICDGFRSQVLFRGPDRSFGHQGDPQGQAHFEGSIPRGGRQKKSQSSSGFASEKANDGKKEDLRPSFGSF